MTPHKAVWLTVTLVFVVLCCMCQGARIPGVCTDISGVDVAQPRRPDIPDQFTVKVECKLLEKNMTTLVTEWYDYSANLARIRQTQIDQDGDFLYDYGNKELLRIDRYLNGQCQVLNLTGNDNNFLFGIKTDSTGREHVLPPDGALHLTDATELYLGSGHIVRDGIIAEAWTSCQYSARLDATMNVTWYFSAKTEWDMQLGGRSVPLLAVVVGERNNRFGGSHSFNHIYDLYDFTPSIRMDAFQLTPGDYCPGRINTKPFPKIPQVFSVKGESLNFDTGRLQTIEEHYDSIKQLSVYKYKDVDGLMYLTGANARTEVNDYLSGYAFMINNDAESCQVRLVSEGQYNFVQHVAGNKVVLESAARIFLVNNVSWEYGGVKAVRGIQCDTWVGVTDQTDIYPGINVTVEYAFAVQNMYRDRNFGAFWTEQMQIPIGMRIWKPNSDGQAEVSHQYNSFDFSANEPTIGNIDLSPCFHGVQKANIRFRIKGTYGYAVTHNMLNFKSAVMDAMANFIGISVLRTADIRAYPSSTDILVSLDLLDKPPFAGDSAHELNLNSLDNAISLFTTPAVSKAFEIVVDVGDKSVVITPEKTYERILFSNGTCIGNCNNTGTHTGSNTGTGTHNGSNTGTGTHTGSNTGTTPNPGTATTGSTDISAQISSTSGYSGGSLAGLGIAMLLVGGGIGSGGGFFVFGKRRGERFN